MKKIQTRALVEGAIFASITVVIGIVRFYMPVIAIISIVWAVPSILIAFRHGLKASIYSVLVSSVLVTVMTQPVEGLGFFIGFGVPGIVMGYMLKKKADSWKTIFITGIVLAVCSFISIYLGMLAIGTDIVKAYDSLFLEMKSAFEQAMKTMTDAYANMGISSEELLRQSEMFNKSLEYIKLILPGGFLISGVCLAFVNFKLTRLVLAKINYYIDDVKPFSYWKLSNTLMLIITAVLLAVVAEIYILKLPQLNAVMMNILTVIMMLFIIMGLSAAKFFMDKFAIPKALKVVFLVILLFSLSNIVMLFGVFDTLLDLRKLQNRS